MFIYNCNVHTTEKVSRRIQLRATEKYTIGKEKNFVAGDKSPSNCFPPPPPLTPLAFPYKPHHPPNED